VIFKFINNPEQELRIGMQTEIEINVGSARNVLSIPMKFLNWKNKKQGVWVKSMNDYHFQHVQVGVHDETYIEIKNGLNEGDSVYLYD